MKYLGFIEEVAGHKNIDTPALLKTLGCFKELSKDKLIDINEEDVMKKMMSQRKWHQETLRTKETQRCFINWKYRGQSVGSGSKCRKKYENPSLFRKDATSLSRRQSLLLSLFSPQWNKIS